MSEIIENKKKIKIVKAIDLIRRVEKEPKPKMLWRGIPEGSMGLITGVAKTGKTTFAENLAISLCVGRSDFFGEKLSGNPKKVLFVNLEESYRLRSRRNMKQREILTRQEVELFDENYISTPIEFPSYMNSEEDWGFLRNYIIESDAEVVFLDSLSHMLVGEIEKSVIAQRFTQTLNKYLSDLNKTIIIVHHNTKGNDKPITQDSVAGSRFILQEFDYAYGLANIPTGGSYACMLFNKHIEKDDTTAILYRVRSNGWFEFLGTDNKFKLYSVSLSKIDNRIDNTNMNLIYDFIESTCSQGSQHILTRDLHDKFVESSTMSKDTLYKNIHKLTENGRIERVEKGVYKLKNEIENEERKEN